MIKSIHTVSVVGGLLALLASACTAEPAPEPEGQHAEGCKLVDVDGEQRLFCSQEAIVEQALMAAPGSGSCGGGWSDGCIDTGMGCAAECWSCSWGSGSSTCGGSGDTGGGSGSGGGCWVTLQSCDPYSCTGNGCTEAERRQHCESLRLSTCGNTGYETPWMGQYDYYCQGTQSYCENDSGCGTGAAHCYNNGAPNSWSCRCV